MVPVCYTAPGLELTLPFTAPLDDNPIHDENSLRTHDKNEYSNQLPSGTAVRTSLQMTTRQRRRAMMSI